VTSREHHEDGREEGVGVAGPPSRRGGIAADWWERQRAPSDLAEVRVQAADRFHEAQAKIKELNVELKSERERRQALEGIVADLKRGS